MANKDEMFIFPPIRSVELLSKELATLRIL
jgi:hypothetical protein